jgi:DNA topoisomerase-3
MRVWIAEKPDAGRNIAKALGGGAESGGHIRVGPNDVVTWSIGHLMENMMPHDYDPEWKSWKLDHLPIVPERMRYKPIPDRMTQLNVVKRLVGQATEIVIATDAGREGEAIAWLVLEYCGWKGPAKRFWTSSLTPSSLAKAVVALIDDRDKKGMYIAARLRSTMDWSDGVNWSRYYGLQCNNYGDETISVGRVQTATLALIVDRDLAIERFKPHDYYELKATMDLPQGKLELMHSPKVEDRLLDKGEAEALAAKCRGQQTTLKVEAKPKNFSPPPPYSLPEIQRHASAKWGWSTDKTLEVVQKLYEAGAVTYPRTDSGHLSEDMKEDMPKHLAALRKRPQYRELATMTPLYRNSIFDDKKVGDHHGIITTEEAVDVSRLGPDAEFLFDLIARRFIACMMPDAQGMTTSISAMIAGLRFSTAGTIITVQGWKAAWSGVGDPDEKGEDEVEDGEEGSSKPKGGSSSGKVLPPVKDGQQAVADRVDALTRTTKPPAHFTDGTLLTAMMSAGAKNPDADIRELLSNGGLGTSATRHEIIKKLKFRKFVTASGKKLISSQRGREFVAILRTDRNRLVDVVATANLERELREIDKNPSSARDVYARYIGNLKADMQRLRSGPPPRKLSASPKSAPAAKAPAGRGGGGGAGKAKAPSKAKQGAGGARGYATRTK